MVYSAIYCSSTHGCEGHVGLQTMGDSGDSGIRLDSCVTVGVSVVLSKLLVHFYTFLNNARTYVS